jgi:hypothetical protein
MACPVCFGGDDTLMRESLNTGIGVLMGVTAIVLAGFARFVATLVRRARLAAPLESSQQSPIFNQPSSTTR